MLSRSLDLTPWAGQLCLLIVGVDLYPGEKRLGQQPPHIRPPDQVGLGGSEHQVTGSVVELHDALAAILGFPLFSGGFIQLSGNPLLLDLEDVHGDGLGVGHLYELQALVLQPRDPPPGPLEPGGLVSVTHYQGVQLFAYRLAVKFVQLDPLRPGLLNPPLDLHRRQIRQIAAAAAVSSRADEVVELATIAPASGVLQS
ncbi:MAG: hypothetical protein M0Z69_16720 [Actinomycetota bacterium]|nr:hypothetical protein [Actinomycetota bacterium]